MTIRYSSLISILLLFGRHAADVHGCDKHHGVHRHLSGRGHDHIDDDDDDDEDTPNDGNLLHNHDDDDNMKQKRQGNLRRLQGIFDDDDDDDDHIPPELISSSTTNHPCKDGEPTFTVGNVTYACQTAFQQQDGLCATAAMSPDQKVKADEHYQAWKAIKEKKEKKVNGDDRGRESWRRRLGGCGDCVDWTTTTITIPTYIHVIHSGTTGKKFTYASNPAYIQNQIKVLNIGFRGDVNTAYAPFASRSYPRYDVKDANTKIQFCLAGTTATDNASWYADANQLEMKMALKQGGSESLNVYVNTASGFAGYAYYPSNDEFVLDGVVLLNESMPGGSLAPYNEGDTLTHEVGHWLGLDHTHSNGCDGPGDYMDLAPPSANYESVKANEGAASFGCQVNLDTCTADAGKKNPIHNFMSYGDDNCMDQFTPGQKVKLQQAWETYRHKLGYSEQFSLAADGYSCVYPGMPLVSTMSPTLQPTTKSPTLKPTTKRPTSKPTKAPKPTKKPTTARIR